MGHKGLKMDLKCPGLVWYGLVCDPGSTQDGLNSLGENSKIASHTQNLIRRMKCTSERLPMDSRVIVINDFCRQLISSG